ncbi:GAF domain-containing protein, partial [Roseateles sp.]
MSASPQPESAEALRARLAQREAELAVINAVQRALSEQKDLTSIYRAVGDRLREVFDAQVCLIGLFDLEAGVERFAYNWENGERVESAPRPLNPIRQRLIETRQTYWNNRVPEQPAPGHGRIGDTAWPKSNLFVPLLANDQAFGYVSLQNIDRFDAFTEADVRLLETIAGSLSSALENVRLFNETQTLLKETEQRNAELAVINAVQTALAGRLDLADIYVVIGDELAKIFGEQGVTIRVIDRARGMVSYPYRLIDGRRELSPFETELIGFTGEVLRTGQPLLVNENLEARAAALGSKPVLGAQPKSQLLVPMIVAGETRLVLTLHDMHREHAFDEADVRLLQTLASSMSVAMENARLFDETQRLLKETEARNAELAVINAVQAALAGRLDMQGIYEAVGRHVQEVFPLFDVSVRLLDREAEQVRVAYYTSRGVQQTMAPYPLRGFARQVMETGQPLLLNEGVAEAMKAAVTLALSDRCPQSLLFVPLCTEGRVTGLLSLIDFEREHAIRRSDLSLLETLARSMGVALENARLFDETQRLLKETEQRHAELAVINSIQQGISGSLDFQVIVDLVGDKLRDVLHTSNLGIDWFDPETGMLHPLHVYEKGQRLNLAPWKPSPGSPREQVLHTRHHRVFGTVAEQRAAGSTLVDGTDQELSLVYMPIVAGDRALGILTLTDYEREHAFGPSEIRLLQTVASSLGTALENARLFDETQRLLKETEQRSTELAIINDIQQAMASRLEMKGVIDLVGDRLLQLFGGRDITIGLLDEAQGQVHYPYWTDSGERRPVEPQPLATAALAREVLRIRRTLRIDADLAGFRRGLGGVLPEGVVEACCTLMVPLVDGERVFGFVSVDDLEREHAFSDGDQRLLETLVAGMSVALQNVRLLNETREALAGQTAGANILRVISSSPGDVRPVLDVIVDAALELLHCTTAVVMQTDGRSYRTTAWARASGERRVEAAPSRPVDPAVDLVSQVITTQRLHHLPDWTRATLPPGDEGVAEALGIASSLILPLMRLGDCIGTLVFARDRPGPFSPQEIAVAQSLCDQAVIGIENARLFNETREALEQQTASAEVLKVISGSPTDVQPVFDRIVALARDLGKADRALLFRLEGDGLQLAAFCKNDGDPAFRLAPGQRIGLTRGSVAARAVMSRNASLIEDTLLDPDYDAGMAYGARRVYSVPLLRDGEPIGAINLAWREPGSVPASVQRIIPTFASQAVIAIGNVGLFNETREALERQTASADILRVISQSPSDVMPVEEVIVAAARRLLGCYRTAFLRLEGGGFVATRTSTAQGVLPGHFAQVPLDPAHNFPSRALLSRAPLHIPDWSAIELTPHEQEVRRSSGVCASLMLPLLRGTDGVGLGVLVFQRDHPKAFNAKDIALAQSFADQAVIGIENVRLFNETKDALERQTATAEILKVIAQSPDDVQPVLDAIAGSARRLLDGHSASVWRRDGERTRMVAFTEVGAQDREALQGWTSGIDLSETYALDPQITGEAIQFADVLADPRATATNREVALARGFRAVASVPLLRDGAVLGKITVTRAEPGDFRPQQIELLKTFADQAVIAIENVRLFNDTKEALGQQTATAEVLQVISGSPTDVQPVFDRIVTLARDLGQADRALLFRLDGGMLKLAAFRRDDQDPAFTWERGQPMALTRGSVAARAILAREACLIEDTLLDADYDPALAHGARRLYSVPLLRDGEPIGAINLAWREPGSVPASVQRIIPTFASQAVIAIGNVGLFNETREA